MIGLSKDPSLEWSAADAQRRPERSDNGQQGDTYETFVSRGRQSTAGAPVVTCLSTNKRVL